MPNEDSADLTCPRIPDAGNLVRGSSDNESAIGTELGEGDLIGMPQLQKGLTRSRIPNSGGLVLRRSDDLRAVRAENGGKNPIVMQLVEPGEHLAGLRTPNKCGLVFVSRNDSVALVIERGEGRCALVAVERSAAYASPGVPDADAPAFRGRDDARAIAAEGYGVNVIFMALELAHDLCRVPDAGGPVV